MSDKKITVSLNINPPQWSKEDTERFIQALQQATPPRSVGGLVLDGHGYLMPVLRFDRREYFVPQKVMRFNFEKGEWDDKD